MSVQERLLRNPRQESLDRRDWQSAVPGLAGMRIEQNKGVVLINAPDGLFDESLRLERIRKPCAKVGVDVWRVPEHLDYGAESVAEPREARFVVVGIGNWDPHCREHAEG